MKIKDHNPLSDPPGEKKMTDEELQQLTIVRLMQSVHGRLFMWSFLSQCGIFSSGFSDNSNRMSYLAGRRDSARVMDTELQNADLKLYLLMIEENTHGEGK